jgi:DNA (cytosine-5)-methyltransferase 1
MVALINKAIRFGSVCSGIEAASVAWGPLGWHAAFFAEIDAFPSAVLSHRFPETPNLGDFTAIDATAGPIDVLMGGTPCQSFSVAGLRKGLDDDRGNLALEFLRLAGRLRPAWVVWENVPGVLSSSGGRDLGAFLGGLGQLGYGWAYRVLDAQHFGVPQRRRRVFVVGCPGDWRRAVAVLFERESLSGHPAPRREARADVANGTEASPGRMRGPGTDGQLNGARTLSAHHGRYDGDTETFVVKGAAIGPAPDSGPQYGEVLSDGTCYTLNCTETHAVCSTLFAVNGGMSSGYHPVVPGLTASGMGVRRMTPLEYERLQGFPDGWTEVPYRGKPAKDGPRYRAIGNSMAVPVVRWIGERLQEVHHAFA